MLEIHQQKSEVVKGVDDRQIVIEFDGIDQGGRSVEQANIAQMEIAVTVAHISVLPARLQQFRHLIQRRVGEFVGGGGGFGREEIGKLPMFLIIFRDHPIHAGTAAKSGIA